MAEYTQRRYEGKQPPNNIWCGTSVENQETYDKRVVHLRNTKAAVLWLSVEPMLGTINFGDISWVGWLVLGGESDSTRRMEKQWAIDARDQCAKAKVPFLFKQWGDYNEQGEKVKRKTKKDRLVPATLDGVVHNSYPKLLFNHQHGAAQCALGCSWTKYAENKIGLFAN
jgi:protein gp37